MKPRKALATFILLFALSSASAQLNGNYTIGGASPDYVNISDAVNALMAQGASGNITFNIRPGTYTGQYLINVISGTPNFTTFRSETMNADDVVLNYSASNDADNYIFMLDSADGVVFEELTFAPLDNIYARAIYFVNDADLMMIDNCKFIGSQELSSFSSFRRVLVHNDQGVLPSNENPDDIIITNNEFLYGNTAVELTLDGIGGTRATGVILANNVCKDQRSKGMVIWHVTGASFSDNVITTTVGNWFTGIRMFHFENSQVRRNVVKAYSTNDCTAFEYSNTQSTNGNLIANNMFYANGEGAVWAMAVYNLWGTQVLYNTAVAEGGLAEESYAFYHLSNFSDAEDTELRNNIFVNYTGGKALRTKVPTNINAEDFDVLFTTGDTLSSFGGNGYEDLAAHQAGTGFGSNSLDLDPAFPYLPDLHLNSCALEGLGDPSVLVGIDIDGDVRDANNPDMGADEFTFTSGTLPGPTIAITGADLPYTLTAPNGIAYNWSTGDVSRTTDIAMSGVYTCVFTDVNGCSYTISITVDVDISTNVEVLENSGFTVFPNPATERLNIRSKNWNGTMDYLLLTLDGRTVASGNMNSNGWVDISGVPNGTYMLGFFYDENVFWTKVLRVE